MKIDKNNFGKYEGLYAEFIGNPVTQETTLDGLTATAQQMLAYVGMLRNEQLANALRTCINAGWGYELLQASYEDVLCLELHMLEDDVEDISVFYESREDLFYDLLISEGMFAVGEVSEEFEREMREWAGEDSEE